MVHLGKMAFETALFFETVEEIYARIFQKLKPRTAIPQISVQFRQYANANSKITLSNGMLQVRISDLLRAAPAPVQEALAGILLAKLFRKPLDSSVSTIYQRYLSRSDIQRKLQLAKLQRGRKAMASPQGQYFDLTQLFESLNSEYFNNQLRVPALGWSRRSARTVLGHYDPAYHAIVLSRILDSAKAPEVLVRYVLYHEMLHIQYPVTHGGDRRCIHSREFRDLEKRFTGYADARRELKNFLTELRSDQ